jgi:polynucleotide 5'-kinase involved in rRNA processing
VDFHGAVNKIEKDSFAKVPFNKKGHYPENLIYYLPIIIKLIHSLFFCDHLHWKNTKLFIVGPPRSGKTSLLRKIENILGGGFF